MLPSIGPSSDNGIARENRLPVFTHAAARRTTSSVIRLSVPISSSGPQRPQLLTFSASARKSSGIGIRLSLRRRDLRVGCLTKLGEGLGDIPCDVPKLDNLA